MAGFKMVKVLNILNLACLTEGSTPQESWVVGRWSSASGQEPSRGAGAIDQQGSKVLNIRTCAFVASRIRPGAWCSGPGAFCSVFQRALRRVFPWGRRRAAIGAAATSP